MSLRRVITSTVVVASAGALTAVTIPAIAGTAHDPDPADAPAVAEPAPALLAAMQRDFGLTAAQVRTRLAREGWARQTVTDLRADLGERYAGAWLDDGAEALMIAVTDPAAAEAVRAAGAVPEVVTRSEDYLASVKATLDRHADRAAPPIAGWYVDVASNTLVMLAPDWAEHHARAFAVDSGVWGDAVRIVASDEQPRLLNDVRGGDAYIIADAARCSIGFSVTGGASLAGGFVTAGHCASSGITTAGPDGLAQGEFVTASFPGVGLDRPDDWGVVTVNEDWTPQPVVNDYADGTLPVAGSQEAPVGASVCKYGSTSGVSCGVIEATDVTVVYAQGTITGMVRTDACAEAGDSGGSWLWGDQAQGVTSGGSGNCILGGVSFYQPLNEILEVNDLTLVTTIAEEP